MYLSNDCYIRVIPSLMTVLLEYIDLNEYSLIRFSLTFEPLKIMYPYMFAHNVQTMRPRNLVSLTVLQFLEET